MAEIALDQLTEAKSQLVAEEEALSAQLSAVQEKIQGLQTVIEMFGEGSNTAAVDDTPTAEPETVVEAEPVVEAAPVKRRGRPRKSAIAPKPASTRKVSATPTKKRGPGRSAKWQNYIREEYRSTPLPDVVANVLTAKPKQVFKIAAVMEELFPADDMPKADFLKARNRVSNILSAGARSGDWFRGRGGTYSCTKRSVA